MKCPKCWGQILKIQVQFQGFVTLMFQNADDYLVTEPVTIDSRWDDSSPCVCEECRWMGTVADALASCNSECWDAEAE